MKPSLRTIAESLNVSAMTVTRALNSHPSVSAETRRRVISKVKELGYDYKTRSRAIRSDREKNVAVFCSDQKLYDDNLCNCFMRLHYLALKRLKSAGFQSRQLDPADDAEKFFQQLEECGALMILGPLVLPGWTGAALLAEIRRRFPELKILSILGEDNDVTSIVPDDYSGGVLAARKAFEAGHRHVGVFTKINERSYRKRFRGFAGELLRLSPETRIDRLFFENDENRACEDRRRQEVLDRYFDGRSPAELPTLFFCPNGYVTAFLLDYLHGRGCKIPEDFCVFGYDNLEILSLRTPEVTRIYFDLKTLVANAVLTLGLQAGQPYFRNTVIVSPNEFVPGKTMIPRERMRREPRSSMLQKIF